MNQSIDFFAVGCACLGAVGGVLFTIGVTLAQAASATVGPPWLQTLGLSTIQFELVLAVGLTIAAILAFAEDELTRYETDGPQEVSR